MNHPWWVKEVDKPVMSLDENSYKRFDGMAHVLRSFTKYVGKPKAGRIFKKSHELEMKRMNEKKPGWRIEDKALMDAGWTVYSTGGLNTGTRSWDRIGIRTPDERGVEKWKGSEEEAALMIKRAGRYYGAAQVGITKLDKRHIFYSEKGYKIEFEDVEIPYKVENEKLVIPEKCKYVIDCFSTDVA